MRLVAAITMLRAAASGQATPDEIVPEPDILPLPGAGIIVMFILRRRKQTPANELFPTAAVGLPFLIGEYSTG
jgi:hypothetical protein